VTSVSRRTLITLLGASAAAGCTTPGIVGRAESDPFEGGIGGTGIVGVLTDFGSLMINGLRVEMATKTRVHSPFGTLSDTALAVGQPLTVFAVRDRDRLVARDVQIAVPLVGTVSRDSSGVTTINGAPVRAEPTALGRLSPGQRVTAYGIWSAQGLIASRIVPALSNDDLIAGVVSRGGPTDTRIEGTPVRLPGGQSKPPSGQYATAIGRFEKGLFTATTTRVGRFTSDARNLRQLSVEGFLQTASTNPGFRIAGLGHSFARDLNLAPLQQTRALYFGRYTGAFSAGSAYVVPQNFAQRRRLLSGGFDGDLTHAQHSV
jgi:hypothetical protein